MVLKVDYISQAPTFSVNLYFVLIPIDFYFVFYTIFFNQFFNKKPRIFYFECGFEVLYV